MIDIFTIITITVIILMLYIVLDIKKEIKECNLNFVPKKHSTEKMLFLGILGILGILGNTLIEQFLPKEVSQFLIPLISVWIIILIRTIFICLIEMKMYIFAIQVIGKNLMNFKLNSIEASDIIQDFCYKKVTEAGFKNTREIIKQYLHDHREESEEKAKLRKQLREKIKEIGPEKKEKAEEFIKTNKIKEYWYNKFEDDTYIVFYHYIKFTKYLSFKEKAYFKL